MTDPTDLLDEPRLTDDAGPALAAARVAAPVLRDCGFRLVRARIMQQNSEAVLQVMAERPDGTFTVVDCERASDALSPALDVEEPVKGAYRLEVSSPGIDRPLVRPSDFTRALGQEARVEMKAPVEGRRRFRGTLDSLEGEGQAAVLLFTRADPGPGEAATVRLPLADLAEARLILTDALIRETLRAAKAEREGRADEAEPNDEDGADGDRAEVAAPAPDLPAKGPGRFAARNAGKVMGTSGKARPLLPAGIQPGYKKVGAPVRPTTPRKRP